MFTTIRKFLFCRRGHLRGKPIAQTTSTEGPSVRTYECSRCGSVWTRAVYPKKVKAEGAA